MKRILSVLLAAAMALSLAGCGERQAEVTPLPQTEGRFFWLIFRKRAARRKNRPPVFPCLLRKG